MRKRLWLVLFLSGCAVNQLSAPVTPRQPVAPPRATPPVSAPVELQTVPMLVTPAPVTPAQGNFTDDQIKEQGQAIHVTTDPPGATIEVNGKTLGLSPGKFFVIRKPNKYGYLPRLTIVVIPPEGSKGLYTQKKLFDGYTIAPDEVHFNLSTPPPLPMIDGSQ